MFAAARATYRRSPLLSAVRAARPQAAVLYTFSQLCLERFRVHVTPRTAAVAAAAVLPAPAQRACVRAAAGAGLAAAAAAAARALRSLTDDCGAAASVTPYAHILVPAACDGGDAMASCAALDAIRSVCVADEEARKAFLSAGAVASCTRRLVSSTEDALDASVCEVLAALCADEAGRDAAEKEDTGR